MQFKLNFKSASRMEAQLSRKIKTKTAYRSSQSEEDRGSNSTELILLCGDGGPEEVGGEAEGGSLVGRHLQQHFPAVAVVRHLAFAMLHCLHFITNIK